jgi:bifunctional non-homologous end joining protein LigD
MDEVAYKSRAKSAKAKFPGYLESCDPTLRKTPPTGADWIHEIKYDGYRLQLRIQGDHISLCSRKRLSWTRQFAPIVKAAKSIPANDAIIDGEVTVMGATGLPDFQALRRQIGKATSEVIYNAFDLLWLNGEDLRRLPLEERKARLERLLKKAHPAISFAEALEGDGSEIYRHACRMGLEGIVSKRRNSAYASGRTESWIKIKCTKSDNFPIVAFVEKLGAKPRRIASFYIGRWEGKRLLYAGKVQTGFTEKAAREVREVLDPYIMPRSPLTVPVHKPKATWVRPEVQAEIKFTGHTDDGLLREAVFKGLRDDLALPKVKAPAIVPARRSPEKPKVGVSRENILQLLPDAVVPTKEALEAYWRKTGKRALKYLARRPLKLVRHTHGTTFYHKGRLPPIPESVHQLKIAKREGGEGIRLWVDDVQGFLGLVSIGAVELHAWNATVDDIEHADTLVFDLDPGSGIEWSFVTDTALFLRHVLKSEGLKIWPKVTGGKGVHLMVPVDPEFTHEQAHRYCRDIAQRIAATDPKRYTVSAALGHRPGRLFIDYLRNGRGTTAVATYSPRVRDGFPIAAPVTWKQIESGIKPDAFTMAHPLRPAKT